MKKQIYRNSLLACLLLFTGCSGSTGTTAANVGGQPTPVTDSAVRNKTHDVNGQTPQGPTSQEIPTYSYKIKNSWPHDKRAYTQGLIFMDGILWESTGQYGASSLRKVDLKTGKVIKQISVPEKYFAEGMTVFNNKVFQLTWQEHKGFIYDPATFQKQAEFDLYRRYRERELGLPNHSKLYLTIHNTNFPGKLK